MSVLVGGMFFKGRLPKGQSGRESKGQGHGIVRGTQLVHGRSRMAIHDPRIPTMSGRSTSGLTALADIACTKCEAKCREGELHPGNNYFVGRRCAYFLAYVYLYGWQLRMTFLFCWSGLFQRQQ